MKSVRWTVMRMLLISLFLISGPAFAETSPDKTLSPYFFIENDDPEADRFPLKSTTAEVAITGVIADVVITQQYRNDGTRPINARYVFPASTRAAVHGMEMRIGDEIIRAEIAERNQAEKKFAAAKSAGKSASLLNQNRPNVFSMNVANILPGDTVDIRLCYTELLVPENGTYEFVYPAVVGPRYSSQMEVGAPETDAWIKNPYLPEGAPDPTRFEIDCCLSTGLPLSEISCVSHDTTIDWESSATAHVRLDATETAGGDRDYILRYRLSGRQIDSGLILYENPEAENFFLLTVQPPECVLPSDIPPREYIFVVDISGSMHGFPLNTAKKLLKNLLQGLKPKDRFNVVLFSGGSSLLSPASLPATDGNITAAVRHMETQRGGGGTELRAALEQSFALPRDENYARSIIIVTDGYISAEREVFALIENNLNRANLFSFGIGSGVNRYLIEGMARAGQGEPFVVEDPKAADPVAETFRQYISTPVLTRIRMTCEGFDTYDVEPRSIPDLFARRPVVVFGKWRGPAQGTITIAGMGGETPFAKVFDVSKTSPSEAGSALKYLWARTRIARLSDFNVNPGNPDTRDEITSLGLTYHLLTEYTSFLAVHEQVRNPETPARDVHQPLPLPKHVANLAVGGSCDSVPEPELFWLLLAFPVLAAVRWRMKSEMVSPKRHIPR
ncbi:MAG: VIT domain-containing protein [Desulfococcus multivorans]|jgi:Ca-activated chloride channel family protein|nr:VIT domain-containing protein [Desulfococcus multivorans]